jgi:hypothetical protein
MGASASKQVRNWAADFFTKVRFARDSPLEEAVSSEPVSEKENSERRQIGRFYEDWERFLMPQSAFSLPANPKMVAFLPIVAGPGSAH